MLRVIVELIPGGFGPLRRTIGSIRISNLSDLADLSDYRVEMREAANPLAGTPARNAGVHAPAAVPTCISPVLCQSRNRSPDSPTIPASGNSARWRGETTDPCARARPGARLTIAARTSVVLLERGRPYIGGFAAMARGADYITSADPRGSQRRRCTSRRC